jgi:hypothetical protein
LIHGSSESFTATLLMGERLQCNCSAALANSNWADAAIAMIDAFSVI